VFCTRIAVLRCKKVQAVQAVQAVRHPFTECINYRLGKFGKIIGKNKNKKTDEQQEKII
jgi:hypothetical protein